jgi:hypothetical protein
MADLLVMNNLISLKMEIIEIEERMPSFILKVDASIKHNGGVFQYTDNALWFECDVWDSFVDESSGKAIGTTILTSMNGVFKLAISKTDETLKLVIRIKDSFNNAESELMFCQKLTDDLFAGIKKAFQEFPKWW